MPTEKWITLQVVMPTRRAREFVEGRFDPLTDRAFVAPGGGPVPDTLNLKPGDAVLQFDVIDNPAQKVSVSGQDAAGRSAPPLVFRVLSPVALTKAKNARIIRATPSAL